MYEVGIVLKFARKKIVFIQRQTYVPELLHVPGQTAVEGRIFRRPLDKKLDRDCCRSAAGGGAPLCSIQTSECRAIRCLRVSAAASLRRRLHIHDAVTAVFLASSSPPPPAAHYVRTPVGGVSQLNDELSFHESSPVKVRGPFSCPTPGLTDTHMLHPAHAMHRVF